MHACSGAELNRTVEGFSKEKKKQKNFDLLANELIHEIMEVQSENGQKIQICGGTADRRAEWRTRG